jgi:hypothetical protein
MKMDAAQSVAISFPVHIALLEMMSLNFSPCLLLLDKSIKTKSRNINKNK